MNHFRELFGFTSEKASSPDKNTQTETELKRLLRACIHDEFLQFEGAYALIASATFDNQNPTRIVELVNSLKNKEWESALLSQTWEGLKDNLEAYVLRLENGKVIILLIRSPYDPFDEAEMVHCEILDVRDSESLLPLINNDKWTHINGN